jgi:hypothetical protein
MTPEPQTMYLRADVLTIGKAASYRLEMNSGMLRFEFPEQPNRWWRWWQFLLLGWRWREL